MNKNSASAAADKAAMRAEYRVLRDALAPRDMTRWSERASGFLVDLIRRLEFQGVLGGYWPIGSEIDCRHALQELSRRGLQIGLPAIVGKARPLVYRNWAMGDLLLPARYGTSEPDWDAPEVEPDLFLVPLLAYDRRGYRLGYGGGYYDRTLEAARKKKPIVTVGFAYEAQEVAELPAEIHDARLDWIVTDKGVRACKS